MKAHLDLISVLAADHHDLLALARRLDGPGAEGRGVRKSLVAALAWRLVRHLGAEESCLRPVVEKGLPDGDEAARRMRLEAAHLDLLAAELLGWDVGHRSYEPTLDRLRRIIAEHVADQEETLLPEVAAMLSSGRLLRLGVKADRLERRAPRRPRRLVEDQTPARLSGPDHAPAARSDQGPAFYRARPVWW